ncbi:MAG: NAD(P)H-binding protein [Gammaproteobacteria bacterium]|nr:NAD(P)H-binding protein [Gammaproteobacteria bacterium]
MVKQADLDWTIVRTGILTDKPARGDYRADNTAKTSKIARADLADFLVKQVIDERYLWQAISVSS